jgi:hypothetical protein
MVYLVPFHQFEQFEKENVTDLGHIPWHLTETGETIPNLPYDSFPDFRFCSSISFVCCYFLCEYSFGEWAEVGCEE